MSIKWLMEHSNCLKSITIHFQQNFDNDVFNKLIFHCFQVTSIDEIHLHVNDSEFNFNQISDLLKNNKQINNIILTLHNVILINNKQLIHDGISLVQYNNDIRSKVRINLYICKCLVKNIPSDILCSIEIISFDERIYKLVLSNYN